VTPTAVMVTCGSCGGSRRAYTATDAGLFWRPCAACYGLGCSLRLVRV